MVGEACLPSNAYYPRTPDYTLYSGVYVCWSEYSDSSFVYGFMSLDYGLGTMTTTIIYINGPLEYVTNNTVRLFADDTLLYLAIHNSSDCSKLQDDLNNLERWESD